MLTKPTTGMQEDLLLLARKIEDDRKKWWKQVSDVRNQEPGPAPSPQRKTRSRRGREKSLRLTQALKSSISISSSEPSSLDKFLHLLHWKLTHLARRTALLARFGYLPYDYTLRSHLTFTLSLRGLVGTETQVNRVYVALRETDARLNRFEKRVKAAEIGFYRELREVREVARGLAKGSGEREGLECLRRAWELGVRMPGGRQRMITEFFWRV